MARLLLPLPIAASASSLHFAASRLRLPVVSARREALFGGRAGARAPARLASKGLSAGAEAGGSAAQAGTVIGHEEAMEWVKKDRRRLLHVVYRVGDLDKTIKFYTECLGMKLLRKRDIPEERYTNAFLGYGPEDSHFVVELTYNYGVESYDIGTGFGHFGIAVEDLFMEGVKAKQAQNALRLEVRTLQKNLQQASSLMDLYNQKIVRLEDQLKVWAERAGRLAEDVWQQSVSLGNSQRKLVDMHGEAQELRQSMNRAQANVGSSRTDVAGLLIELEKERFSKKRLEDDLDVMSRKANSLRAKIDESVVLEKLRHEAREYRGILKCGICHDRQKEVVITKCYHLFCNQCIQKSLGNRQRRCPHCGLSFGANDVKPIYI